MLHAMPYAAFSYKAANDPEHWSLRAEEARTVAESFINSHAREQMMKIVDAYERLAQLAASTRILPIERERDNL
jgi:hypothetical protein